MVVCHYKYEHTDWDPLSQEWNSRYVLAFFQKLPPLQLTADYHLAFSINPVDLKKPTWRCRDRSL
jgi:hypothetical protein